jgi:hypothetical protein
MVDGAWTKEFFENDISELGLLAQNSHREQFVHRFRSLILQGFEDGNDAGIGNR